MSSNTWMRADTLSAKDRSEALTFGQFSCGLLCDACVRFWCGSTSASRDQLFEAKLPCQCLQGVSLPTEAAILAFYLPLDRDICGVFRACKLLRVVVCRLCSSACNKLLVSSPVCLANRPPAVLARTILCTLSR